MVKKTLFVLYFVVVAVMAAATFVEHTSGERWYAEWWFTALWALLTGVGIIYFLQQRVRKPMAVALHLSFVLILLGALLTHLTSRQGAVHLRVGEETFQYFTQDGKLHRLPFSLRLDSFAIDYHNGTTAAADYKSFITFIDEDKSCGKAMVSMNHIASHRHVRLYQSNYDRDGRGSVLSLNRDPWGIPFTYAGYALLFVSLVWMLLDPKGQFRQLLRSPLMKQGTLILLLTCSACCDIVAAPRVLPKETADKFGHLFILYNNRICPVETYALDFTKKLYGKRHYGDYTACQVLTGFIFFGDEWQNEPIVRIKGGELKEVRQLPDYCTVNSFFYQNGKYSLKTYVEAFYHEGLHDGFHQQAAKLDDLLMMVIELRYGTPLSMFPHAYHSTTRWYSPTESVDSAMYAVQST